MGKVAKVWEKDPPKANPQTLAGLWADFLYRLETGQFKRDPSVEVVVEAESLARAIWAACRSRGKNGKMWHHQSKVKEADRQELANRLTERITEIKDAPTFFDLYNIVEEEGNRIHGIGPLTTYDVAMRLATRLRLPITRVWVHTGVALGLRALGRRVSGLRYVDPEDMPAFLRAQPDQNLVEDFLCCYRVQLEALPEEEKR
jgi:hypothetical protein